jgi:hypothetical protein
LRLQYELFSDSNPFMRALLPLAERVREDREPVAQENLLLEAQGAFSKQIVKVLEGYGQLRDHACEELFHAVYGSPLLQAMVGLKASDADGSSRHRTRSMAAVGRQIADFKVPSARAVRRGRDPALMYIRLADETRRTRPPCFGACATGGRRPHAGRVQAIVRDQFFAPPGPGACPRRNPVHARLG